VPRASIGAGCDASPRYAIRPRETPEPSSPTPILGDRFWGQVGGFPGCVRAVRGIGGRIRRSGLDVGKTGPEASLHRAAVEFESSMVRRGSPVRVRKGLIGRYEAAAKSRFLVAMIDTVTTSLYGRDSMMSSCRGDMTRWLEQAVSTVVSECADVCDEPGIDLGDTSTLRRARSYTASQARRRS
jgi:hypothetical protein